MKGSAVAADDVGDSGPDETEVVAGSVGVARHDPGVALVISIRAGLKRIVAGVISYARKTDEAREVRSASGRGR